MAVSGQMIVPVVSVNAMGNMQNPVIPNSDEVTVPDSIEAFEPYEPEENDLLDLSLGF